MCVVGFQLPILFEENKHSYHLMLQEFNNINGFDTFFEIFFSKFDVFTAVLEPGQNQEQKLPGTLYDLRSLVFFILIDRYKGILE